MVLLKDVDDARKCVEDARLKWWDATNKRDELIRAARAEGYPLRAIASAAGVSHQTVANVVAAGASDGAGA